MHHQTFVALIGLAFLLLSLKHSLLVESVAIFVDSQQASDKCECLNDENVVTEAEEQLKMLFRINVARLVIPLQNLTRHANEDIMYMLREHEARIHKALAISYPRLLTQPAFVDAIKQFIQRLHNEIFFTSDLFPEKVQDKVHQAAEQFLNDILPILFLCAPAGQCRIPDSNYIKCLQSATNHLKKFAETEQFNELSVISSIWVLKYRLLRSILLKLQRYVVESGNITKSCIRRFADVTLCGQRCTNQKNLIFDVKYCSNSCKEAVYGCFNGELNDWDVFLSILNKLGSDFNNGFNGLDRSVSNIITYILEEQSSLMVKTMYRVCGALSSITVSNFKLASSAQTDTYHFLLPQLINNFVLHKGIWQRITDDVCIQSAHSHTCWNGTQLLMLV